MVYSACHLYRVIDGRLSSWLSPWVWWTKYFTEEAGILHNVRSFEMVTTHRGEMYLLFTVVVFEVNYTVDNFLLCPLLGYDRMREDFQGNSYLRGERGAGVAA